MTTSPETPAFLDAYNSRFWGILRWEQLTDFWTVLEEAHNGDWYIYAVGETPPAEPASKQQFSEFVTEIDKLLRQEHDEDYCGIVYTDDRENPGFVKIFDPNNLGATCGASTQKPLPGWTISRLKPINLPNAMAQTGSRKRWWQTIFSS